ncbi:hypothetical protein ACSBR1_008681 [Camellia fascicularis]
MRFGTQRQPSSHPRPKGQVQTQLDWSLHHQVNLVRWSCGSDGSRWLRVFPTDQHGQVEEILPLRGSLGRKPERAT